MPTIIDAGRLDDVIAWRGATPVNGAQFVGQALTLAASLPDAPAALNLIDDRYAFMLGFVAVALRGQINLLPPSAAPDTVRQIADAHPRCYLLTDRAQLEAPCPVVVLPEVIEAAPSRELPTMDDDATVAIAYTSGSTGAPQPHAKRWGTLMRTAQLAAARLFEGDARAFNIVGTVPTQHMYGLELTMSLALAAGCRTSAARPFFAQDIADALAALPEPRLLVTTPLHLRACVASSVSFPKIAAIVSATAPLSAQRAAEAEARFDAPLREIYGCTEAGSLATRRTARGDVWHLHDGMQLRVDDALAVIDAAHLDEALPLQDSVERIDARQFRLLGRSDDLVKVGGKRASLSELSARLLALPGVEDAAVFLPDANGEGERRPVALVVAPQRSRADILAGLAQSVDAVLLPRPLLTVERLPRNALGKLSRAALLALLEAQLEH
jgi:acyl-coenzyme A synthetase/AMP-(fatty) acid ligase